MEHRRGTLKQGKEPPNAQTGPCNELRLMDEHVLMANVEDNTGYGTRQVLLYFNFFYMETEKNKQDLVYLVDSSCFTTEFL